MRGVCHERWRSRHLLEERKHNPIYRITPVTHTAQQRRPAAAAAAAVGTDEQTSLFLFQDLRKTNQKENLNLKYEVYPLEIGRVVFCCNI